MLLQKVLYSLIYQEGLSFVYIADMNGKACQFETYDEAKVEKRALALTGNGEKVYILKETREIIYNELDEEYTLHKELYNQLKKNDEEFINDIVKSRKKKNKKSKVKRKTKKEK